MAADPYTPRDSTDSVLYTVVREHLETFRVEAARLRDGQGLPRFVDAEFAAFLRCGFLAGGFARFRCDACRTERLVAFSCKTKGKVERPGCRPSESSSQTGRMVSRASTKGSISRKIKNSFVATDRRRV
jgi:transposase-like zinc-binding protein